MKKKFKKVIEMKKPELILAVFILWAGVGFGTILKDAYLVSDWVSVTMAIGGLVLISIWVSGGAFETHLEEIR